MKRELTISRNYFDFEMINGTIYRDRNKNLHIVFIDLELDTIYHVYLLKQIKAALRCFFFLDS